MPRARYELVRLTRREDGVIVVDEAGTAPGRGAYLCRAVDCVERGLRRDRLARAFRKSCRVMPELTVALRTAATPRDVETQAR